MLEIQSLIISEILFSVTYIIAALVLAEFIKSKDGTLRKIMIAYFIVEVFVYFSSGVYFFLLHKKWTTLSLEVFAIAVTIPKVAVKLWLLWWLKSGKQITLIPAKNK